MTCIMIILSQFCAVTNMTTASRQLFSFARDRGTPFHTFFRSVSGSAVIRLYSPHLLLRLLQ